MRRPGLLIAWLLLVGAAGAAAAQETEIPLSLEGLTPGEVNARLGFLEERLDAGRNTARAWQYGWTGVFGAGAVLGAAQAITADDGDERVYQIVGTVKSVGALAQMLTDPLPARLGAEPMRAMPEDTPRGRQLRLAVGERQLVENAARAESRFSLRRHLEGVTTNLIGGAVIWALGDRRDAALSTLSGIVVGQAQIWSQPWRATSDLDDYREAFPTTIASRGVQWELRPTLTGVQLAFRY
ncbi:MAG: hypothetical protein ACJ8H8_06785 [Geminicoccaceae bacterium]